MKFSKKKFLKVTNRSDKKLYSKYLDDMDDKEVSFENNNYGIVNLNENECIYPINREWCEKI